MALLQFIKVQILPNAQSLPSEIYKYLNGLTPEILSEVFKVNETIPYNLRILNELYARNPKTVRYVTETISFLPPKIRDLIPQDIKDSSSSPCFKKSIRKWKPTCSFCLCKTFLQHVGFMQLNSSPPFSVLSLFEVHITCSLSYYILSARTIVT